MKFDYILDLPRKGCFIFRPNHPDKVEFRLITAHICVLQGDRFIGRLEECYSFSQEDLLAEDWHIPTPEVVLL